MTIGVLETIAIFVKIWGSDVSDLENIFFQGRCVHPDLTVWRDCRHPFGVEIL